MIRALAQSLLTHAADASYRSLLAAVESVAIAWDHLTATRPVDDPLDARWMVARAMREVDRADREVQQARMDVRRMRETLAEMQAQREQARAEATANAAYRRERDEAMAKFDKLHAIDAETLKMLGEEIERLRAARSDAAQNLSAAEAVIADLRVDMAHVRAQLGVVGEESVLDGLDVLRRTLGARDGETVLRAAERVVNAAAKAPADVAGSITWTEVP